MKTKLTLLLLLVAALIVPMPAQQGVPGTLTQQSPTRLDAIVLMQNYSTAGGTGTITISPPSGQFAYIVEFDAQPCNGTAATATSGSFTTTGLGGNPKWQTGLVATAQLCGNPIVFSPSAPFKSAAAGTNVTFVTPTGVANATWNMNVFYYFAP